MSFFSYLEDLCARWWMDYWHQCAFLFVFLVVLQGALGNALGIISRVASFYFRNFSFVLDGSCSLGPCRAVCPVPRVGHCYVSYSRRVCSIFYRCWCSRCVSQIPFIWGGGAGLTLDFTSFQPPGRSDCLVMNGLLTSLCTPAVVLLSVLTGRV